RCCPTTPETRSTCPPRRKGWLFSWNPWCSPGEFASAIPQQLDNFAERGIAAFAAPADQTPELVVAIFEQHLESGEALALEQRRVGVQKPLEHQLVLEQAAAAAPAQTIHFRCRHVRAIRCSGNSRTDHVFHRPVLV